MAQQLNKSVTDHSVDKILERSSDSVNKRKRVRRGPIHFNDAQKDILEKTFSVDRYPDIYTREKLADELCVSESRIQVWFQNRRSRFRRSQKGMTPTEAKNCSRKLVSSKTIDHMPAQKTSSDVTTLGYPDTGLLSYRPPGHWNHSIPTVYPMYHDVYQSSLFMPSPYYFSSMPWANHQLVPHILTSEDGFHRAEARAADMTSYSLCLPSPGQDSVTSTPSGY